MTVVDHAVHIVPMTRDQEIHVRLSSDERNDLQRAADARGQTVSQFVRWASLRYDALETSLTVALAAHPERKGSTS